MQRAITLLHHFGASAARCTGTLASIIAQLSGSTGGFASGWTSGNCYNTNIPNQYRADVFEHDFKSRYLADLVFPRDKPNIRLGAT